MKLIEADEVKEALRNRIGESIDECIDNVLTVDVLDKIKAEITAIAINGQVDEHTAFIRTGGQVKQMALDIIDKYKTESEE